MVSFQRTILDFRIDRLADHEWVGRGMATVHITGSAFLWHQVLPLSDCSLGVRDSRHAGVLATKQSRTLAWHKRGPAVMLVM